MGTPIKIADMARDLIRLSGFEPDVDIQIEYIGLRAGEKLCEELITEDENTLPTSHEKITVLKGVEPNLDVLDGEINKLARFARKQNAEAISEELLKIIPEYNPICKI
jgi:FlaA1/EpsC-like NDP-sugar epimerase